MKAYGFKQLKRKEGLSFYLKGFMKNRPFKGLLKGAECNHLDDSDYLSDASDYSVSID
jgi:hypothetical protein